MFEEAKITSILVKKSYEYDYIHNFLQVYLVFLKKVLTKHIQYDSILVYYKYVI